MRIGELISTLELRPPPPVPIGVRKRYVSGGVDFFSYRAYGLATCRQIAADFAARRIRSAEVRLDNGQLVIVRPIRT